MHLLYSRFWTKVLYDAEILPFEEPFTKLANQGVVQAADGVRMSKSRGNVITPDSVVERFGADSLRAYELFMAPFDQNVSWSEEGVRGVYRWLNRVWQLVLEEPSFGEQSAEAIKETRRWTHRTLKKVTEDLRRLHFNTMISALMEFTNYLGRMREDNSVDRDSWQEAIDTLLVMLAPSAPYIAEEMFGRSGRGYSVHQQAWPDWDQELAQAETFTLVVQVNGKLRDRFEAPIEIDEATAKELALASERVSAHTDGHEIERVLFVPRRLVNIVLR